MEYRYNKCKSEREENILIYLINATRAGAIGENLNGGTYYATVIQKCCYIRGKYLKFKWVVFGDFKWNFSTSFYSTAAIYDISIKEHASITTTWPG